MHLRAAHFVARRCGEDISEKPFLTDRSKVLYLSLSKGHNTRSYSHSKTIMNVKNSVSMKGNDVTDFDGFVLEKSIFTKVFEKDIKRVYIYKKSERLAKAVHLICPAFKNHPALKDKIDAIAIGLVEGAILPPTLAREALARELLALSSVLSIAKSGGGLSVMNAEIIGREAHLLLQEIAMYEDPKVSFESLPTLSALMKISDRGDGSERHRSQTEKMHESRPGFSSEGHLKDKKDRKEAILTVLKSMGAASIKDISTVIRDVSEKTIQRELKVLVASGRVIKDGERRWSTYALAPSIDVGGDPR